MIKNIFLLRLGAKATGYGMDDQEGWEFESQ
jgi:hypothetical protein